MGPLILSVLACGGAGFAAYSNVMMRRLWNRKLDEARLHAYQLGYTDGMEDAER